MTQYMAIHHNLQLDNKFQTPLVYRRPIHVQLSTYLLCDRWVTQQPYLDTDKVTPISNK